MTTIVSSLAVELGADISGLQAGLLASERALSAFGKGVQATLDSLAQAVAAIDLTPAIDVPAFQADLAAQVVSAVESAPPIGVTSALNVTPMIDMSALQNQVTSAIQSGVYSASINASVSVNASGAAAATTASTDPGMASGGPLSFGGGGGLAAARGSEPRSGNTIIVNAYGSSPHDLADMIERALREKGT